MPKLTTEERFEIARKSLVDTERGQEASMYGPLRDLFIEVLGYPPNAVDIDRTAARGRPDVTVFAPGAAEGERVQWIVLEAKDERGACLGLAERSGLFLTKSKYITADTAWFLMVDPTTFVARPADRGADPSTDVVLDLSTVTFAEFLTATQQLAATVAGVPSLMRRFREGDETLIGLDKLSGGNDPIAEIIARNAFFDGLEETTQRLQEACHSALVATRIARDDLIAQVQAFSTEFNGYVFHAYPVSIEGRPSGREQTIRHGRETHRINRLLAASPSLARLVLSALPSFAERTGIDPKDEAVKLERFFATETANLILARILLIRFLEDHGFFDELTPDGIRRRRYLCNGGVAAFQGMRSYFAARYTRLLEDAYRSGARIYSATFNETEHDWVLELADEPLSRNVEWAMFRFARFDFTTIKGDVLTGVYDRFLDAKQRKAQGEYYTPPSIARFMLDHLDLGPEARVLDPACGSGTFLIERYQQAVGEDADRGIATYLDAREAMERIAGNDLNPFSAVLSQIQLLWHLLSFGQQVKRDGIPDILVSERANSLVPTQLRDQSTTLFGDIDVPGYAAVVGNPPYVRPERAAALETTAHDYYSREVVADGAAHRGISVEANIFNLFIFRALDYWCSPLEGGKPGKLAFIVPLAFCSSQSSAGLRQLFGESGRWTITEIVDLELIWQHIFDADVLPMILFAEARPPKEGDRVTMRTVDESAVILNPATRKSRPSFDLDSQTVTSIPYADLFTPEGRIVTRLSPERLAIVKKLRGVGDLAQAAKRYWTRRKGGFQFSAAAPTGIGQALWEEHRMITDGVARRNTGTENATDGLDVYKGENIRTGSLVGLPAFRKLDVWNLSTASLWKMRDILPHTMWCLPVIEQVPCAAPFDPAELAVTNTATIFGPRDDLEGFPFDMLLTSRIYGWYTLLSLRSSYLNKLRSHMYPAMISKLPWSETLPKIMPDLLALRAPFFDACRARFDAEAELTRRASELSLVPLKRMFREVTAKIDQLTYSDEFDVIEEFELVPTVQEEGDLDLTVSAEGHTLSFPNSDSAAFARLGFELAAGQTVSRSRLLELPVPSDEATARALRDLLASFETDALELEVFRQVDDIDALVGEALGLAPAEIAFVQTDMRDDAFLSRVQPRYPYFTPKQRGRRTALESAQRYAG